MNWQLRDATEADREFLFDVHRRALGPYIIKTWGWDEQWQRDHFDKAFAAVHWKVIVVDGVAVGGMHFAETNSEIDIEDIEIAPEHQNKGIGTAILQALLGGRGKDAVLQVLKANPDARRLYERLGFRSIGEDEVHIRMRRRGSSTITPVPLS